MAGSSLANYQGEDIKKATAHNRRAKGKSSIYSQAGGGGGSGGKSDLDVEVV